MTEKKKRRVSREEQIAEYLASDAWEQWQKDYPVPSTWKENPHSKDGAKPLGDTLEFTVETRFKIDHWLTVKFQRWLNASYGRPDGVKEDLPFGHPLLESHYVFGRCNTNRVTFELHRDGTITVKDTK